MPTSPNATRYSPRHGVHPTKTRGKRTGEVPCKLCGLLPPKEWTEEEARAIRLELAERIMRLRRAQSLTCQPSRCRNSACREAGACAKLEALNKA